MSSDESVGEKKRIVENVSVVNIEVPVRVFLKGEPVDNLKKEDFKLYEGGKLQKINGFWIKRKNISVSKDIREGKSGKSGNLKSRYFVLVFRTTKFNKSLKNGISYVFNKVLRAEDRLMIFVNDRTFLLDDLRNKKNILDLVLKMVSRESKKARMRQLIVVEKIKTQINQMKLELAGFSSRGNPADELKKLLENYLAAWNEYKLQYLTPSLGNYYNFARYLEKIDGDKWVINFYQLEVFPKLKPSGEIINYVKSLIDGLRVSIRGEDIAYSQMLSNLLMRIDIALDVSSGFPTEQISKLFYKVGAVFHSIFIKTQSSMLSRDLEYRRVSTNIENNFRELTRITGGELISSNNIEKSLNKIVTKKDILYMLTYYPSDEKRKGEIKVVIKDKNYRVVYDNNIRQDYIKKYFKKMEKKIPTVKILYTIFSGKKLKVAINGFYLRKEGNKKLGKMKVHIKITDNSGNIRFDQEKILVTEKKLFSVSLGFPMFEKGEYSCIVSALDLLTDKSDMKYISANVD